MSLPFSFDDPDEAIASLASSLQTTAVESLAADSTGRILASNVLADRDSPAADVSAMDGYGIRMSDLQSDAEIPVAGESVPGSPPPEMPARGAIRIFTGAIVPAECDAVIKREDTQENQSSIRLTDVARQIRVGEHIRRAGENEKVGNTVITKGTLLDAAACGTMANFGAGLADVHARVRVTVITTGDEVITVGAPAPKPWQLRNSNQLAICSQLSSHPWVRMQPPVHCKDDQTHLTQTLKQQLASSDAIILTGGVSMGDYDYVPDVVKEVGGKIIFHGLPVRPGKPILGAATPDGKLILGLPGNPVSATVGCRRFGIPLLSRISGNTDWLPPCPMVRLSGAGDKSIPLHWMRLVRMVDMGVAEPVISKGSGDLVSLGKSHGFVELPPGAVGEGPWPYRAW